MIPSAQPDRPPDILHLLNPRIAAALRLLHEALATSKLDHCEAWEYALEISELRAAGLTNTDLRHLLSLGYAVHVVEQSRNGSRHRRFRPVINLKLPAECCFILTECGLATAARLKGAHVQDNADSKSFRIDVAHVAIIKPVWDVQLRQLRWDGHLVKQFRLPAPNQETLLAAFQEQDWSVRIDDPLPKHREIDPKVRLHDTIKALNRHQLSRWIVFRGDGTGRGVTWRVATVENASPERPQSVP